MVVSTMTSTLPTIAVVQSDAVDADIIEAGLRNAGMRNPILRYDSADALIAMLSGGQHGGEPHIAVAIVESSAWKLLSNWRDTRQPDLLPFIVIFEHDRELHEFTQARVAHAAGTVKPFTPKVLIRMLEPLRCRWLLIDSDGAEEGT